MSKKVRQWEWELHDELVVHFEQDRRTTTIKLTHTEHKEAVKVVRHH